MQTLQKAVKNHKNCVMSAVNCVSTDSYISTIEGFVLTHNQSTNCDPSIERFTVKTSCAWDLLTSPATSTAILGHLVNVGPHICKSLSSKRSLEELDKYGHCSAVETLAGLSGQTAAWLNVIIVMQQWVFFQKRKWEYKWAGVQRIQLCSCGSRPTVSSQHWEILWIQLDLSLSPPRPPAHSRCAAGYQDTGSLCPLTVTGNCFFSFQRLSETFTEPAGCNCIF